MTFKFSEVQGPVIQSRRKPESIIHQRCFPGTVSRIHGSNLWNGHMGLIYDNQEIITEEIHQCIGCGACRQSVQVSGIIFNTGTKSCLTEHLNIKIGTFRNALSFQKLVFALKKPNPFFQFFLYVDTSLIDFFLRNHIMGCRKDRNMIQGCFRCSGKWIHLHDPIDFIPKKFNSNQAVATLGRINLYSISTHTEGSPFHIQIVSIVLDHDQFPDHLIPVLLLSGAKGNDQILIFIRASQSIDAGYRSHYYHIFSFRKGGCGR